MLWERKEEEEEEEEEVDEDEETFESCWGKGKEGKQRGEGIRKIMNEGGSRKEDSSIRCCD